MAGSDRHAAGHESGEGAVRALVGERLLRLRESFAEIWADLPSRWYAVAGIASLWLTVSLVEPAFLALGLGAAAGIWLRRGPRAAAAAEVVDDEWF